MMLSSKTKDYITSAVFVIPGVQVSSAAICYSDVQLSSAVICYSRCTG